MFRHIPSAVLERMRYLEEIDAADRQDGTPRSRRLRQIPPETGRFIALLAASAPEGELLEIGTSAGYSTLWLALACLETGRKLTTFEVLPDKVRLARETFSSAGIGNYVDLIAGDAREYLPAFESVAFCFLDAEKEQYEACYETVVPNMVKGGILVADNAINHQETLAPMLERALNDRRVNAMVVPVGKGELVCWRR